MDNSLEQKLLNDDISILFRRLSMPAILGLMASSTYQFIDLLFIGRWLGVDAIAAISLSYLPVLVINGLGSLIGTGAASVLSRAIGAGERETIQSIYPTSVLLSIMLAAIVAPIVRTLAPAIIGNLSKSADVTAMGSVYLRVIAIGIPFSILSCAISMTVRAEGRVTASVIIIGAGSVLNIALDPIFIRILGQGLKGAALATIISQGASLVIGLIYILKHERLRQLKPKPSLTGPILTIGSSGIMMNLMTLVQLVFVYVTIGWYGTSRDIAVLGTCMTILNLAFIPLWGISQALQPLIGINYGAGKNNRMKKAFSLFARRATIISILLWLVIELFPAAILGIFIIDADTAASGGIALRLIFGMFFTYGFLITSLTLYQATGKIRGAFILMLCRMVIVFIPVLLTTSLLWKSSGIWMAFTITDTVVIILNIVFIHRAME